MQWRKERQISSDINIEKIDGDSVATDHLYCTTTFIYKVSSRNTTITLLDF
jgi:hypothetical protein